MNDSKLIKLRGTVQDLLDYLEAYGEDFYYGASTAVLAELKKRDMVVRDALEEARAQ